MHFIELQSFAKGGTPSKEQSIDERDLTPSFGRSRVLHSPIVQRRELNQDFHQKYEVNSEVTV